MARFDEPLAAARAYADRVERLNARYQAGAIRVSVPEGLREVHKPLDEVIKTSLPTSYRALEAASKSLFYSLPVAFDPGESVGCYLATVDRGRDGEPYRFLDMGALIATQAFGENEPAIAAAVLRELPFAVCRYAHSEYQTVLSLRLKAELDRIAPRGTPRHFVVNTGAEAVENALKAVLLNRVVVAGEKDGGFIISFEGAFHGRSLGALAVTNRKKARTGFPTFDWPQAPFPTEDPADPAGTARREEKTLRAIWDLLVSGRLPGATKSKEGFKRDLDRVDAILAAAEAEVAALVAAERTGLAPDVAKRARRVAAVLVEPIQGEGGVRSASARFFRRLRVLTRIYDVPLIFDEIQMGWGATGKLWAHEWFDLPFPPDVVTWAKKAQNGVLFVSEDLATFFQEEKKFNTTWEGDSVGMVRLLAMLDELDLGEVERTGAVARAGLEALAREYKELVGNVRGRGVMLAFDVVRRDWRDVVRDRAFRRGLILLPAGERALRFYPRYDTPPHAIEEAIGILRAAIEDTLRGGPLEAPLDAAPPAGLLGPRLRSGPCEVPVETVEEIAFDAPARFDEIAPEIMAVEIESYGRLSSYPADVLQAGDGGRPLLQYPRETLRGTVADARGFGIALRDAVTKRIVAYAIGSPLENHDELGVRDDPHHGEGHTFYLQALAVHPCVQNRQEVQNGLLDRLRARVRAAGFEHVSMLIEDRLRETGPEWLRRAAVLKSADNYLRSGERFSYLQAPVGDGAAKP